MVMTVYGSQEGMDIWGWRFVMKAMWYRSQSMLSGICRRKSDGRRETLLLSVGGDRLFPSICKDIPEEVAKKARYMVVSLPSNPVGSIAAPGLYEEIVEFARKYDILIIHDNAYSDIIFDEAHGGSFLYRRSAGSWCGIFQPFQVL